MGPSLLLPHVLLHPSPHIPFTSSSYEYEPRKGGKEGVEMEVGWRWRGCAPARVHWKDLDIADIADIADGY